MEHLKDDVGGLQEWVLAHESLERLAHQRAELDWEEGMALLRALRSGAHRHLGYGSFSEYVERLFGYSARTTDDKLRTAVAVEQLPDLSRALREGSLNWSAARELSRVATTRTERAWLDAARGMSVRQIEHLVSGHVPGDLPTDPTRTEAKRYVLRFEVGADTLATFREAVAALRRRSPDWMEDDDVLLQMAREILRGPSDAGRANYQVAVTVCERCGTGFQDAVGERVGIDPSLVETATCDAQCIGSIAGVTSVREERECGESEGLNSENGQPTHVGALRSDGATQPTHVGALSRATQEIPPATRRWVLRRDGGCCVVPGCRNATFVDIHHLTERAKGGTHEPENLVTLCGAHHRAVHRGQIIIEGTLGDGLCFRHADGTLYTEPPSARAVASPEHAPGFPSLLDMEQNAGGGATWMRPTIRRPMM